MNDFYEALVICAFDVDAAKKMMRAEADTLPEVVNEILTEAGLDNAVAAIQS